MCTSIAIASAELGSLSQFGPSSPVRRKSSELITPHSGLSMKRIEKMVGIDGTAHGMMKITDSQRIQRALVHEEAREAQRQHESSR